jgi:predicted ester cyclase
MHMTIQRLICEGDVVGCQMSFTDTHREAWRGIAPTGRVISFAGSAFDRIVDGKRVDHVGLGDFLGIVYQLGGIVASP